MKKTALLLLILGLATASFAQQKNDLHILNTFKIKGNGGWDYLSVDQQYQNLYISHSNQVNIINKNTGDSTGIIPNTQGVHGIAISNTFGKGYTSNGKSGTCTVFNLATAGLIGQITVGQNPDAIFFDDFSKKVIVFNGESMDASIIDPVTDKVIATIPLGGKPEAGISDDKGKIYVNIENTSEIVCFDAVTFKVLSRFKLKNAEEPSGLAIDRITSRLFTVCANKVMLVLDAKTGREITVLPIGAGCDGVVFDPPTKTAYSANGEGTVTVVQEVTSEKFVVLGTIKSKPGARTIALDLISHHIFLPTVDYEKATGTGTRPKKIAGTFQVLEIGK